jgi:hypothetical protein
VFQRHGDRAPSLQFNLARVHGTVRNRLHEGRRRSDALLISLDTPFCLSKNLFERMSPSRRIAFGNHWWKNLGWLCIAVTGMAQTNQVDRAQLFRANAPPGPLVPGALSSEEIDYAPHSENDTDLGTQRILKEIQAYQPWTVQFGVPIYYTSNVALVRNGEQSDAVFTPGIGVTYQPRITKTLYAEFSLQHQFFEYARFDEFDFTSFDAVAGLVYHLPQFHNLSLRARYDFNRLTDNNFDQFFTNHQLVIAAEMPFQFSRAHYLLVGGNVNISMEADPVHSQRNDYETYVAYALSLSRSFSVDAAARIAVHDYRLGDRADLNELLSFSANYRIADWLAISAISSFAWSQSNHSVFDYSVANVGGALTVTVRF